MIKYRTGGYISTTIDAVEIERETVLSVWVKGNRYKKFSDYDKYFDTFEEAKKYLIDKETSHLFNLRHSVKNSEDRLAEIKELKS